MQLQQSTAASLRANWLGIINVDVLAMADSEGKLGIAQHRHDNRLQHAHKALASNLNVGIAVLGVCRIYACVSCGTWRPGHGDCVSKWAWAVGTCSTCSTYSFCDICSGS